MYRRYLKMPIILGTILYLLVIYYFLVYKKSDLTKVELTLLYPSIVGVLIVLRVISVFLSKVEEAGEKTGRRLTKDLFNKLNKK